jgi:uncharacterized protein (DUF1800 family)
MAFLDPYAQPLTAKQAAHLLRRTTFGASPNQIKSFTANKPQEAIQKLLMTLPAPAPPVDPKTNQPFVDLPFNKTNDGQYSAYLKYWWLGTMMNDGVSMQEKMTLFWQNHFVSTLSTVNDSRYLYRQYSLLRQNALGNFRQLVMQITKDPAMLRYLNGDQNVAAHPNENYGRELQELFTIGRNGNYTEDDVKAAARVLTGWTDIGYRDETNAAITTLFRDKQHDATDKLFSAAYGKTVIKGRSGTTAGDEELADLVDMLLKQSETARFICRKLYRFFIDADITAALEASVIGPLADLFVKNDYEIKPVLTALFTSQHFYDDTLRGAMIKSPLELLVGTARYFESSPPQMSVDPTAFYALSGYIAQRSRDQQQDVLDQPTVFGWRPYYDTGFYQIWISANTLALRGYFTDQFITGAIKSGNYKLTPSTTLTYARLAADPSDPVNLIDSLTDSLFAIDLTRAQKDYLIDNVLIAGLPRYEWSAEWLAYTTDATNMMKRNALQKKLDSLFQYLFRMAEYQLC